MLSILNPPNKAYASFAYVSHAIFLKRKNWNTFQKSRNVQPAQILIERNFQTWHRQFVTWTKFSLNSCLQPVSHLVLKNSKQAVTMRYNVLESPFITFFNDPLLLPLRNYSINQMGTKSAVTLHYIFECSRNVIEIILFLSQFRNNFLFFAVASFHPQKKCKLRG